MDSVSIVVATYGSPEWSALAYQRAIPSAMEQGCQVVIEHGDTLAGARNHAAAQASGDWLVFLDADDELAPGYVDAMLAGWGGLRVPTLVEVSPDGREDVVITYRRNMERLNCCPIGTAIRRDVFFGCGGFPDFPAWEDWALFLRAYRRGEGIGYVPRAVYRAHVNPDSRNRTVDDPRGLHAEIRAWA